MKAIEIYKNKDNYKVSDQRVQQIRQQFINRYGYDPLNNNSLNVTKTLKK
jgi:hypothetical protein